MGGSLYICLCTMLHIVLESGIRSSGTGGCELPQEIHGPLEGQQVLLTTEASLQNLKPGSPLVPWLMDPAGHWTCFWLPCRCLDSEPVFPHLQMCALRLTGAPFFRLFKAQTVSFSFFCMHCFSCLLTWPWGFLSHCVATGTLLIHTAFSLCLVT